MGNAAVRSLGANVDPTKWQPVRTEEVRTSADGRFTFRKETTYYIGGVVARTLLTVTDKLRHTTTTMRKEYYQNGNLESAEKTVNTPQRTLRVKKAYSLDGSVIAQHESEKSFRLEDGTATREYMVRQGVSQNYQVLERTGGERAAFLATRGCLERIERREQERLTRAR